MFSHISDNFFSILLKSSSSGLNGVSAIYKYRIFNFYYNVTVDGTGVHSYDYEPYPECPYKEYANGKKVWSAQVLEAKIVCSNGFSISIATERIKNPANKKFDKPECQSKAFDRLSEKI